MGLLERLRMLFGGKSEAEDSHRQKLEQRIDNIDRRIEEARRKRLQTEYDAMRRR